MKLIVKTDRPLLLIDREENFTLSVSQHEIGDNFQVPDSDFFNGKINEGLLFLVRKEEGSAKPNKKKPRTEAEQGLKEFYSKPPKPTKREVKKNEK